MNFHQIYSNDAFWNRDECFRIWGEKVKVQGHGAIEFAGNSSLRAEVYSTLSLELIDLM